MNPALRTAATGMAAQQTRTEVIANNLANVNTTAFKRSRASFEDLLYQSLREVRAVDNADATTLGAVQVGRGVRLAAINRVSAQGTLEQTDRALDLAIQGDGHFGVRNNDGDMLFTRDGNFQVSDRGYLVTKGGFTVEPGIQVPDGATVSVGPSGIVTAQRANGELVDIGRIAVYRFPNTAGLLALGDNLYQTTPASGEATEGVADTDGNGRIESGFLESSNVEIVTEMVEMIAAQRAYEINSKAVKAADEMSEVATQMLR